MDFFGNDLPLLAKMFTAAQGFGIAGHVFN